MFCVSHDSTPDYSLAKKMALEIRKAIQSSGDYLGKVWAVIFNMLGIDFYKLSGFSLVICKPDKKIIYSDCQWSAIQESATLGSMVLEKVTLVASRRIETGV